MKPGSKNFLSSLFALISLACVSSETYNLQRVQSSFLGHKRSSLCQVFLAETVETGTKVVYHLPQIPENSGWDVNGKSFFGSSHWKIPGTNANSE